MTDVRATVAVSDETWAERADRDPRLRAYVDAEIAKARVASAAWKAETQHWQHVAEALDAKLQAALSSGERNRQSNQRRQVAHRRRRQFAAPLIEAP